MKILVVGGGGREHAIIRKLRESPRCGRLFCLCQDAAGKPLDLSDKSGLGSLCLEREGIRVAALVVLNALGNVYDARGNFLAGGRFPDGTPVPHAQALDALAGQVPAGNTVLTVVATNVPLDKTQCSRLARMAATGLARQRCCFQYVSHRRPPFIMLRTRRRLMMYRGRYFTDVIFISPY